MKPAPLDSAAAPVERPAAGNGPAHATEAAPPGLLLPPGTATHLLTMQSLPAPKRRALTACGRRLAAAERELAESQAALRAEMASAEVVNKPRSRAKVAS